MRRIGIDVGGTNTDAVLLEDGRVVHAVKTPTTADVTGGIVAALGLLSRHPEVARGRIDLHSCDQERGWRRLRAIPGIGSWTVEMLALRGQGRHDQVPAADLGLLKLVGRLLSRGDPRALASEQQVREFFAPYGEWAGLAATHTTAL